MVNNMKIIYDNIIFSLQKAGGISLYWKELASRMVVSGQDISFYGYPNENIFSDHFNTIQKKESFLWHGICRYMDFRVQIKDKSIFHSSYYRVANQKNVVNIITLHDFTYEYYARGLRKYIHLWQKGRALEKGDGIICVSENTKKDLLKFYPFLPEEKIKVIYLGASDAFCVLSNPAKILLQHFRELDGKRYILYVGDRKGYKNFNFLVKAFWKLKDYTLVMVGGGALTKKESKKLTMDYVHFQGLSAEELNILYNNAFCMVYPSLYEGFGIPVLEAMRAGCPVIAMNSSSIPEVAGNAAILLSVDSSSKELWEAIFALEKRDFRQSLVSDGLEQSGKFSWDKTYEETLNFYQYTWNGRHH